MPTFWMLAQAVSATVRLKCCGQAVPSTRLGRSSVPVISAAALAMSSPIFQRSMIFG